MKVDEITTEARSHGESGGFTNESAPIGGPFTPEQQAELDQDLADIAAGRARLVPHEDMPCVLEEIGREQAE